METLDNGMTVTDEQANTMRKLITRMKKKPEGIGIELGYGALMCTFDGLTIGIEKDGYAHS